MVMCEVYHPFYLLYLIMAGLGTWHSVQWQYSSNRLCDLASTFASIFFLIFSYAQETRNITTVWKSTERVSGGQHSISLQSSELVD